MPEITLDFTGFDLQIADRAAAEANLYRAIDLAHRQKATLWVLRATISLARLRAEQGERAHAGQLLAPVHGWFTGGFDTQVLREATALLAESTHSLLPFLP